MRVRFSDDSKSFVSDVFVRLDGREGSPPTPTFLHYGLYLPKTSLKFIVINTELKRVYNL